MEESKKTYGDLTLGVNTESPRKVGIIDYLRASFVDNRFIMVAETEEGGYILNVENLMSSGREPTQTLYLTKESLSGLVGTIFLYLSAKGFGIEDLIKLATDDSNIINYTISDNLSKTDFDVDKS